MILSSLPSTTRHLILPPTFVNTQVGTSEVMHDADLGGQDPKNMYIVPESAMMFIIEFLS